MGDVRGSISNSSTRRSRSVVERGESSFSRKRARPPPPPPQPYLRGRWAQLRYHSEDEDNNDDDDNNDVVIEDGSHGRRDDDVDNEDENNDVFEDGSHGRDDDNDADREEDEQRESGSEDDERDSSRDDDELSSGGSDADDDVVEVRGVAEEQPPALEDSDDDDRPIRVVSSRAPILVRRGSTSSAAPASTPAPAPAPPPESPPAPAPAPPESSSSFSDSSSVIKNVTVENSSAFDCSICYHPLKPPIFQCTVGHVVCSPCHDKLQGQAAATRCHICRVPNPGGSYLRCNAMEQAVDAIRVACPHAAHGCAARPAYHGRDAHVRTCAHRPSCRCPGEGCGFAGSVRTTLLEHFAAVHGWPCSAGRAGIVGGFDVSLVNGFNVVTVTAGDADQGTATTTTAEEEQYTVVLHVEQAAPVYSAITAFCIHPSKTGTVKLGLSYYRRWRQGSELHSRYIQSSQLDVVCTDLCDGMPGPSSCFPLLVPMWSAAPGGGEDDDDDIKVTVNYIRCGD